MRKFYFIAVLIPFISFHLSAQISVKDSSVFTPYVGLGYAYHFVDGDLARRFGNSNAVQLNLDFKTKKYWTVGINGSYIFGKDVKESLFDSIATPSGAMINKKGEFGDVRLYERGFTVALTAGRMFSWKKPNPNSGIVLNLGVGFIQHKIRIE
ncbi:MAG TPA: hypothetical protein VGC65_05055, partial [Bacteroidia bacterium]